MTEQTAAAPTASANGQAGPAGPAPGPGPAPGQEQECGECATSSERVMGIVGLVFAAAVAAIALDLLTGGKLSALAGGLLGGGGDAEG